MILLPHLLTLTALIDHAAAAIALPVTMHVDRVAVTPASWALHLLSMLRFLRGSRRFFALLTTARFPALLSIALPLR